MKQLVVIILLLLSVNATAQTHKACLLTALATAADSTTLGELRALCAEDVMVVEEAASPTTISAIQQRIRFEQQDAGWNPFVLVPHKPNYLVIGHQFSAPNTAPFDTEDPSNTIDFQPWETKFQLSLKVPLARGLFGKGSLYAAYTNRSFWQQFNKDSSSPFRETNHEPEAWLSFVKPERKWLGVHIPVIRTGFSHQSNGQAGALSRSWNRVYAEFLMEKNDFYFSFKPWWRVTEAADDDDNADIGKYMGTFELRSLYKHKAHTFDVMVRNNLRGDNKGAIEFGWSFPISGRVRGYAQWFNGYGESLIDYDAYTNSVNFGIQLSDWL